MTGGELVGLVAIIGTTFSGILTTLFHSRCSKVRCCWDCINCDREIIHEKDEQVIANQVEAREVEQTNNNNTN